MKEKIISVIIASILFVSASVYADGIKQFSIQNGAVVFDSQQRAVISCYDSDGGLAYSNMYIPEDGVIRAGIPNPYSDMQMKAYIEGSSKVVDLERPEAAVTAPSKTPETITSVLIEPAPTSAPTPFVKPYPSVYPKQTDAVNALMVCEKVSVTQNKDDETAYLIEAFYQGKKTEIVINADTNIESVPEVNIDLLYHNASVLKKGDVFKLTYNLAKTKIKQIDLIFRPDIKTIAYDNTDYGSNFEKIFLSSNKASGTAGWSAAQYGARNRAKYQYAFGIIVDKTSNTVSLMNKDGKVDDMLQIDLDKETIVYKCDVSEKYKISSTNINGITRTFVPKSLFYEDEITWTSAYDYSYALVRIIDDTATDIVVFNDF